MVDFFAAAQRVISMIMTGSELGLITWLASGGIIYLLRGVSFWIDTLLVKFISSIYGYFMMLLKGTLFNEAVTDKLLANVYVFIGVFVFFRIAMVLIKFIMNPELIADEKAGVNSLIKRVIIGMCGIIVIPLIFDKALELQAAIIEDQLIQQIIIPSDMIDATSKNVDKGGALIGTYVFSGFISPSSKAPEKIKKEYDAALKNGDLSSIDFNSGGFLGVGYTSYDYSYFYLISTFVLGYVLYLMLKYCLDIVVRFFKLLLYQLVAPIAMVEYMVSGSENGVFKNWKTAVLGTYFMLFVRVLAIWFVVFVMSLMTGDFANYTNGSLLTTNDYLLRALIIIGLLAFMMDLPKIVGNIFGIDLEQESSATGLLKSVGGIMKGIGMGALSMGGAAIGGAIGAAGGFQKAGLQNRKERNAAIRDKMSQNPGMSKKDAISSLKASGALHGANASALSSAGTIAKSAGLGALKGIGAAAMGSTSVGKAVQSGYGATTSEMSKDKQKERQQEQEARQEARADARHQELMQANQNAAFERMVNSQIANNPGASRSDIIDSLINTQIDAKLSGLDVGQLTADISGRLTSISDSGVALQPQDVVQNVQQVLSSKLDVSPEDTTQIVNQVLNGASSPTTEQVDQIVNQVVNQAKTTMTPEVTQVVNQVMGKVANGSVSSTTQKVEQVVDSSKVGGSMASIEQDVNLSYNDTPESLLDNVETSIKRKVDTPSDEIETIFDTDHIDG